MINMNYFVVVDLETDGPSPNDPDCNPIQIAAVIVDPRKLQIVKDSEFSSYVCPDQLRRSRTEYFNNKMHRDTINNFHCPNFNMTSDEFLDMLEQAPDEKQVWNSFHEYLKSWHVPGKAKTKFNAPILVTYNGNRFDKIFLDRLAQKYKTVSTTGESTLFCVRHSIDLYQTVFMWNESLTFLSNYKMDTLRTAFGIDNGGIAHEGLNDCYDEATLLIKYLELHRTLSKRVKGWT